MSFKLFPPEKTLPSIQLKRKSSLFSILAVNLGVAVGFLLIETALHVLNLSPPNYIPKRKIFLEDRTGEYHCYPVNKHGELSHYSTFSRLKKDGWYLQVEIKPPTKIPKKRIVETPWCSEIQINSYGMRVLNHEEKPEQGSDKILIVGDSFVYGDGVPYKKSLPFLISQYIAPDYKAISIGKSGLNTKQEVELALQYAVLHNVKKIVLVFVLNDIQLTQELENQTQNINDLILLNSDSIQNKPVKSLLFRGSRVVEFIQTYYRLYEVKRKTIQWYLDSYDRNNNMQGLLDLQHQFFELANKEGIKSALVLYPLVEGFDTTYPFSSIHKTVSELAGRVGLPVLDLAPVFKGKDPETLWVYDSDHHPNGKANSIAAEKVGTWIKKMWEL